ncbi:phage N-6-adenine-methyltransferase [Alteromonadaceae bacterium M269]|nr:phage N-6-adenine-methyltransferase [Alteromonadaceae bacterium M269]
MANDLWETPAEVFAFYDNQFSFVLDAAASSLNAKCDLYLTEEDDALTKDWAEIVKRNTANTPYTNWVWLNCPYSNPLPWVDKAIETMENGVGVFMLLNNDTSPKWFAKGLTSLSEVHFFISNLEDKSNYVNGRIQFINSETKKPVKSNNKPQCGLVFNPNKSDSINTQYLVLDRVMKVGKLLLGEAA